MKVERYLNVIPGFPVPFQHGNPPAIRFACKGDSDSNFDGVADRDQKVRVVEVLKFLTEVMDQRRRG